jgi:hypothetical protein
LQRDQNFAIYPSPDVIPFNWGIEGNMDDGIFLNPVAQVFGQLSNSFVAVFLCQWFFLIAAERLAAQIASDRIVACIDILI